jgi:hypothetical protein
MKVWHVTALITGLVLLVAVPFAIDAVSLTCMPWNKPVEAHLTVESVEARAGQVAVHGSTDLPDRAIVQYFFLHSSELGDVTRLPQFQAGGAMTVSGGAFRFEESLSAWPEGEAVFDVWFEVGPESPQPAHVVAAYGSNGQCLTGPQVGTDSPGDRQVLRANARVSLPND